DVTVAQNAGTQTIVLTGISSGSTNADQTLKVSAASSSRSLLPEIQYASPGSTALLRFSPPARSTGTATITVTVNDGNKYNGLVRRQFAVKVTPAGTNNVVTGHDLVQTTGETNLAATLTTLASANGEFDFQVTGIPGGQYVVQASSDLMHWTSIQTNTAPFVLQDKTSGIQKRYYRAFYQQ
ncbi:MAG TPA: hypothetical protein VL970_02785, partial [Candidatus Acidoferrales bacterium]|nr:hypothetical protein [Candidatus Acidoferrales bacterium]